MRDGVVNGVGDRVGDGGVRQLSPGVSAQLGVQMQLKGGWLAWVGFGWLAMLMSALC